MKVYLRWNVNADSYNGGQWLVSVHMTFEDALATISDNIRRYERECYGKQVANFAYETIEEWEIS